MPLGEHLGHTASFRKRNAPRVRFAVALRAFGHVYKLGGRRYRTGQMRAIAAVFILIA
jgi:hypothetical protein